MGIHRSLVARIGCRIAAALVLGSLACSSKPPPPNPPPPPSGATWSLRAQGYQRTLVQAVNIRNDKGKTIKVTVETNKLVNITDPGRDVPVRVGPTLEVGRSVSDYKFNERLLTEEEK